MTQGGYAPEWIWQNEEGLNSLALWQPREYFIFAMSTLMFPACGKKEALSRRSKKHNDFQNRITAWQQVQEFDVEIVKPLAELCRRIIAKCKPAILHKVLAKCSHTNVAEITASLQNMAAFHLELEDLLKWLVANLAKLEAEDKRGFANFAAQRMIMGLSTLELEVCQEMNDFELIPDKSACAVEVIVGKRYAKSKKPKAKYSGKAITVKGEVAKLQFNTEQVKVVEAAISANAKLTKPLFKPTFNFTKGDK